VATDTLLSPAGLASLAGPIEKTAWRYGLSAALLCAVASLFRSRAHSLLLLHQRELDLAGALRASGAGRWEWDVGLGRWSYGGRLYRDFGLRDSPEDGAGALAHVLLPSRRWRRWARSRLHRSDIRRLRPYLRRVLEGREHTVQAELRMCDDQGRWHWLILRGHAVATDARGRALRLAGMQLDITEEREMLEALRASEERYTTVYQTLPDAAGITMLADGRYLDVNPAFERLFSLPREQIVGRTSLELGIWRDLAERDRLLDALEHHGEARGLPMTAYRGEQRVPGLMSARTTHLGGEAHVIFVFHDLSQEQRVRDELLAANSLLRQAGWLARLGVWTQRPGQGLIYWSDVCFDIHGLEPGAPLPADYLETFVAPEWREPLRAQMRQSLRAHAAWHLEMEIVRADGRRLWVRARGEPVLEGGRVVSMRGILQDIDEMRRATQELRASEERLARIFRLMPSPMGFSRRADGTYLDVNPAWEAALGHPREQAIGRTAVEIGILTTEQRATMAELARKRGELIGHETEVVTASGERRTLLQSLSTVQLHGEDCWLFVLHDITERKRGEQLVREREELLSLTIAAASLGLWDWDLEAGTVSGDPRWRAMLGLPEAPAALPWTSVFGEADTSTIARGLARHLGHPDQPFDITVAAPSQDRAECWVRNLGKVVARTAQGEPQRMVGLSMDVTGQRAHEQQLERMAHYDALTGLANRALLERLLREGMLRSDAGGTLLGVAYLDLDGFKPINDRFGHAAGDRLLVLVAERLRRALRSGDSVARLGGDEFVLLLHGLGDGIACGERLHSVLASISAPYLLGTEQVVVTASIGYTLYPEDGPDADTLLRHADQAMYMAKQDGRNRCHAFDAAHERAQHMRRIERARLLDALAGGELELYLQPKVDMRLGVVVGAEALARWRHPERGVLAPAAFLHLVDGSAELQAIFGEWVVDTALQLIARLMHAGLHLPISINITPEHLHREGFADWMASRMARCPQVPARLLQLELTESAALYDIEHVARELDRVRAQGVGIAFDDFGTGYSSLTYLRRLPIDHLKLDRSFIAGMLHDTGDRAIVQAVIGLGRSFGCETVAEGVETEEQGLALLQMGCQLAQGYCIAAPMPAGDFAGWARTWAAPPAWCEAAAGARRRA
ncbi:sensor domain-containing protein, partial [Melaminivora alkalimesophila]